MPREVITLYEIGVGRLTVVHCSPKELEEIHTQPGMQWELIEDRNWNGHPEGSAISNAIADDESDFYLGTKRGATFPYYVLTMSASEDSNFDLADQEI